MFTERTLWLGATVAIIGLLVLMILQSRGGQGLDGSPAAGLSGIPVHAILVDPGDRQRLYLRTDLGVIVSVDGGQTWMAEGTGPKQLFAFTHGRGAWRIALR